MSKLVQLDIHRAIEQIDPKDFFDAVEATGINIFSATSAGVIRRHNDGKLLGTKVKGFEVVSPEEANYHHLSRVARNAQHIGTKFYQSYEGLKTLGAQRLVRSVSLATKKGGIVEGEPTEHELVKVSFDYIDIVRSALFPDQRVFALKRLPTISDEQDSSEALLQTTIVAKQELSKINERVASYNQHPRAGQVGEGDSHEVEDSIPFARTKCTDDTLIKEFLETLGENLLPVTVTLGPIEFSFKS